MKRRDGIFFFGFSLFQRHLIITVKPMTVTHLQWRYIFCTLFHPVLNEVGQHYDNFRLLFPYHAPEVGDCVISRRLAANVILVCIFWSLRNYELLIKNSLCYSPVSILNCFVQTYPYITSVYVLRKRVIIQPL